MSQQPVGSKCVNDHEGFCLICGHYILLRRRVRFVNDVLLESYNSIFGIDASERNVQWSPSVFCEICYKNLTKRKTPYSTPMIWRNPENHPFDCYYCQTRVPNGINQAKILSMEYPDVSSIVKPTRRFASSSVEDISMDVMECEPMPMEIIPIEQHSESIAGVMIDALKKLTENVIPRPNLVANALIKALLPLDNMDVMGLAPITSSLINALTPIANSSGYEMRPRMQLQVSYDEDRTGSDSEESSSSDLSQLSEKTAIKMTNEALNDCIRDCGLTKDAAKMFGSRMVQVLKQYEPKIIQGLFILSYACNEPI